MAGNLKNIIRLRIEKISMTLSFFSIMILTTPTAACYSRMNNSICHFKTFRFFFSLEKCSSKVFVFRQKEIAEILFWIRYPRVRYPKQNDLYVVYLLSVKDKTFNGRRVSNHICCSEISSEQGLFTKIITSRQKPDFFFIFFA